MHGSDGGGGGGCGCDADSETHSLVSMGSSSTLSDRLSRCHKARCPNRPVLRYRDSEAVCEECLQRDLTRKMRRALFQELGERSCARILLAFSGGPSSRFVFGHVAEALRTERGPLSLLEAEAIFVDESDVIPRVDSKKKEELHTFLQECEDESGIRIHVIPLSSCMRHTHLESVNECDAANDSKHRLLTLFNSLSTLSAKEQMLEILRTRLIEQFALDHGFQCVVYGDNAITLAVRVMSACSTGIGRGLRSELLPVADLSRNLHILRPNHMHLCKELVFFNRLRRWNYFCLPSITTLTDVRSSIQRLAEDFIMRLQSGQANTVFRILRAMENVRPVFPNVERTRQELDHEAFNISSKSSPESHLVLACPLCYRPLTEEEQELLIVFAHRSQGLPPSSPETYIEGLGVPLPSEDSLARSLCYSCQQIFRELCSTGEEAGQSECSMSSLENLAPPFVQRTLDDEVLILRRVSEEQMRSTISEFLLSEEDE